jgi:hypothetical protein
MLVPVASVLLVAASVMIIETRPRRRMESQGPKVVGIVLPALLATTGCSGRSNVDIGGPCVLDESCVTGVCLRESRQGQQSHWRGGYCSGDCEKQECPSGTCVRLGDGRYYCASSCTRTSDCRDGYACATASGACLPDCRLGWSCGSTIACNDETGICDLPAGAPRPIGAPCTWNAECASGLCTPENTRSGPTYWTGGSCTQHCPIPKCPTGSVCVPFEPSDGYCVASCDSPTGCRAGYVCAALDVPGCLPDCSLGWSCGTSLLCDGATGLCLPPSANTPDGGTDASVPRDVRPDEAGQRSDAMGGGRGGAGGPGPGGPTRASVSSESSNP